MQPQSREDFIKAVTSDLPEPPAYFPINAKINKEGYSNLDKIKAKSLQSLTLDEFKKKIKNNAIILDTRNPDDFTNGFIPGSLFIGLKGRFAEWAGSLLPFDRPVVLITEEGKEEETVIRLARVGFENVEGYLAGGFEMWKNAGEEIDLVINVEADELAMDIPFDSRLTVVDVRRMNEFAEGHVTNAINMPLDEMTDVAQIAQLEEDQNLYVHCKSGYRSVIAASLLKQQGYHNLRNVLGGWSKIKEQKNIKTEKEGTVLN
jgi:rhodanese-related sulfurtransferase